MVNYRYINGITHYIFVDDITNQYAFSIHVEFNVFSPDRRSYKLDDLMKSEQRLHDVMVEVLDSFNRISIKDGPFDGVILIDRVHFDDTNAAIQAIVDNIQTDEDLRRVVNKYITSKQRWHY